MELTREDIQALRRATTVVVRINSDNKASIELTEKIWTLKRGITLQAELEHSIDIHGTVHRKDGSTACFVLLHPQNTGAWQALTRLVKIGDTLTCDAMDNGNQYLKKAQIPASAWQGEDYQHPHYNGFHNDTLFVSVWRDSREYVRNLELSSSVCPNNSARNIR